MSKHRSLSQALLDPQKAEFIHGGKPKNEKPSLPDSPANVAEEQNDSPKLAVAEPVEAEVKPEPVSERPREEKPRRKRRVRQKVRKGREPQPTSSSSPKSLTHAVVPVTTRFRQDTAEALRRASLERKLAGELPSTQQEIIEQCVANW